MKLTILMDNNTYIGKYYLGEPGLCYLIEDEGEKLLLDTGYSDAYVKNAKAMGIDLREVDKLIISHGHNDHTGGLPYFPFEDRKRPLIAHPDVFTERRKNGRNLSCPLKREEAEERFELVLSDKPLKISKNITFLGSGPRFNDFESNIPVGEYFNGESWEKDFIKDDCSLVYQKDDGIYIITACSHAGICNIISYAKKVTGCDNVKGLIGGLHLLVDKDDAFKKTGEFLREQNIPELYPCHCTGLKAKMKVNEYTPIKEAGVGLVIEW